MASCKLIILVYVLVLIVIGVKQTYGVGEEVRFDKNYNVLYGDKLVSILGQGRQVQLSMDRSSGSGFVSKRSYGSGFFHLRMKLPPKDSSAVVTSFYLSSTAAANHEEIDFEFLGNNGPITLQTNVFANGKGNKEQRIHLWFDPTADFHDYQVLWNQHLLVFYVDNTPIRVFKNKTDIGVSYPSSPMEIKGTIWEARWATSGRNINWSQSPFQANYRSFDISGCLYQNSDPQHCQSLNFWWNTDKHSDLSPAQHRAYQNVRNKYMYYDYCSDKARYPQQPLECASNL